MERQVNIGKKYKHFKGATIKVLNIASHTETCEKLVVYEEIKTKQIWARPIDMFLSKVDFEEYPDVNQKYRFEELD